MLTSALAGFAASVVLIVAIGAQQQPHRWLFGVRAAVASGVWFSALGLGAHRLAPMLSRPTAWRVLDGLIAVVMAGTLLV